MPKRICHRCLYLTESFFAFRKNVKQCEIQLHANSCAISGKVCQVQIGGTKQEGCGNHYERLNGFLPDDDCEIIVVDPNQECESSDDFSMEESDTEYPVNQCANGLILRPDPMQNENSSKSEINGSVLNNNTEYLSEQKNTFLCQYCDMAFTVQIDCNDHESRHDAANPFICNFCPFRTGNRQVLIFHIKEAHDNERPYVCTLCNKGFCRRSDLKKHTIVHTGVRPFSCTVCAKSFSRNTNLTKHMRIHTGIKPHVCQKCPRSFITSADLLRHQKTHTDIKPHKCLKCSASFTRKDKLQKHYLSHLRKDSELMGYNADSQNATESSENIAMPIYPYGDVSQHIGNKDNHRIRNSSQNDDVFPSKTTTVVASSLLAAQLQKPQAAMRIRNDVASNPKSNIKIHICNICFRTFTRKREFERHQALHLDSLYKCKICDKNFNRKDKLIRHKETHHAEQYSCNQCNISFSKLEALQMHLKIHDLHKSAPGVNSDPAYFGHLQDPPRMALGFYSEIKPEERMY